VKIELVPASEVTHPKRKSPAELIKDQLDPDQLTLQDVAARYGLHPETIRRVIRKKDAEGNSVVNAPSLAVRQGGLVVYVFTPDDIEELDAYFARRGRIAVNDKQD
jgi:hypothetical protein